MPKRAPRASRAGRRLDPPATPSIPGPPWHLLVIAGTAFLVYGNTFGNAFVWDDQPLIIDNPAIKSWAQLSTLWGSDLFPRDLASHYYRPLQALTYLLDYQLWGLAPLGFHLTNTLLHAGVALLLYGLISLVVRSPRAALLAALLFAVHPIHTEAVTYISGRSDPLSALFLLASLVCFLQGDRARFTTWRGLSLAAFALALLAREAAMALVLLVVLVDLTVSRRDGEPLGGGGPGRLVGRYGPYVAVLLGYLVLRTAVVGPPSPPAVTAQVALPLRLLTMLKVIVESLGVLLVPLHLHMERLVAPAGGPFEPAVVGSALVVGALVAGAVLGVRRAWPVTVGVAWFFIALLPVSNLVPLATFMAEHWLYVPSMGLFLAAGWSLQRLMESGWRAAAMGAVVLALVAYGGLTIRRNLDWRDSLTLYQATLKDAPPSARVYANLGWVYQERGELEKAEDAYQQALKLDPHAADPHNNLGTLYRTRKLFEEAVREFRQAVALNPHHAAAHNNLGLALLELGRPDEAKRAFEEALRLNPDFSAAHSNLGNYYFRRGELARAREEYRAALRLNPGFAQAHNNLGSVYFMMGQLDLAEDEYRTALQLDPHLEEVRRNLGVVIRSRSGPVGTGSGAGAPQ